MDVPVVGRGRELAELRAALAAASTGSGRLLLVSGEPGIGKTSLCLAALDMAGEYGVPAAYGCSVDDPGMPPLWPWRAVGRAVPALADVLGGGAGSAGDSPADAADSAQARFMMFAAACQALSGAAARRGLLVVLDDLQWADQTSLLLLRHLAGELASVRLLVVAAFREPAVAPLAELLPALLRTRGARTTRLSGLAQPDIVQWLRRLEADGDVDQLASRLRSATGGNPLFLRMLTERGTSLIDAGLSEFPGLQHLILARLSQLGKPARELLDVASVLGEQVDPPLLAEVAGMSAAQVGLLLDQAVAQGVLVYVPDIAALTFRHAMVRDATYDALAPSRRMTLHEQAATALERSGRGAAFAGQVASHWQRSGAPGWAARCVYWAREAGRSATASLAHDEAARFTGLALRAAEADTGSADVPVIILRAELSLDAARAEFAAGRIEASLEHCQAAARLAGEASRPDILAAAALVITGIGDPATIAAVDTLCAKATAALPAASTALRARLLARQAIIAAESGACNRARELSAEALAFAEQDHDPDALLDGLHARHFSLCAPQFLTERHELAARACQAAQLARQPLAELWGHVWLTDAAFQAGDLAEVDRELSFIEQFAVSRKHTLAWWHLHRLRATRAALVGELDAAVAHNEAAQVAAAKTGAVSTIGIYYAFVSQLALLRGSIDRETGQAVLTAVGQAPEIPLVRVFTPLIHALLGNDDMARATFEEFRHMPGAIEVGPRWFALLFQIGTAAVMLDDAATADGVYRELSPLAPAYIAEGSSPVFSAGSLQRVIGDLALATGRVDEAVARYTDAIEMNAKIGARPFLALSRLGLAKALVAGASRGDLPTARALTVEAAAQFRQLDLPGPLAAADTLLAGIDSTVRTTNPLSPRESEVASLVARAMTNRQIAERLTLSERTVETHVRSILAKLGYSTRTEIATWLLRQVP